LKGAIKTTLGDSEKAIMNLRQQLADVQAARKADQKQHEQVVAQLTNKFKEHIDTWQDECKAV